MTVEQIQDQLNDLLDLIKKERRAAIGLDMQELTRVTNCKQQLIAGFNPKPEETEGLEDLIKEVDSENRRNAYLLWTGLGWVREVMGFFGKANSASTYGLSGQPGAARQDVHILSGKV